MQANLGRPTRRVCPVPPPPPRFRHLSHHWEKSSEWRRKAKCNPVQDSEHHQIPPRSGAKRTSMRVRSSIAGSRRNRRCTRPILSSTAEGAAWWVPCVELSAYPVVIINWVRYLGPPGPFSFPDSRDLPEVLGGLSWQRETPREDPLGSGRIP